MKRMKKYLSLALIVLLMTTSKLFAQSSLLATLSHEGNVSIFQGNTALKEAIDAAAHGDIITLSSGSFNAVDIDKAITLRGAGMEEDVITGILPTRIVGNFVVSIPSSTTSKFSVEGICNTELVTFKGALHNPTFQKCSLKEVNATSCEMNLLTIIHCKITEALRLSKNTMGRIINSYIRYPYNESSGTGALELSNCVLLNAYNTNRSVFTNCILDYSGSDISIRSSNSCYNCISFGQAFDKVSQISNYTLDSRDALMKLFKTDTFFEFTDTAKKMYIGNDGTEIGLYGGNLPFSIHILSPKIIKCNVSSKTTSDGKLSVDIEVKAEE
jgi:hypothetical protein